MRRGPPFFHVITTTYITIKAPTTMTARSQITGVKDRDPTCAK